MDENRADIRPPFKSDLPFRNRDQRRYISCPIQPPKLISVA
jgi:hypothetical protein